MFHKPLPGTVQVRYEAIRIRRRVVVLRWSVYIHLRRWYGDQHQYAVHFLYLSTWFGIVHPHATFAPQIVLVAADAVVQVYNHDCVCCGYTSRASVQS